VLAAIKTFEGKNIVLILGGDDKGLDYSRLYQEVISSVKHVVVLGPGLRRMSSELRSLGFSSVEEAETMEQAVKAAAAVATAGDVVLLSPASSSFDLFKNYEERGERFNDAVKTL
jgi:UDP-N-acetylmuramoylalanine--D-glutamate ligase